MKKIIGYSLLGILAYCAFLVMTLPAQRVVSYVQQTQPDLRVAGVSGTAWSGRINTLQFQGQNIQRLKWQFDPLALFTGKMAFDVAFSGDGRSVAAGVAVRPDGALVLSDLQAKIPASDINPYIGMPGVALAGLLELQLEELVLKEKTLLSVEGDMFWRQAGVAEPVVQSLGGYSATLTTLEEGVSAQVKDDGGPLEIEGSAKLSDGSYSLDVTAAVRDNADPGARMIQQGLNMLGARQPDGRYLLNFSGKL